jgi:hypothetical protein
MVFPRRVTIAREIRCSKFTSLGGQVASNLGGVREDEEMDLSPPAKKGKEPVPKKKTPAVKKTPAAKKTAPE